MPFNARREALIIEFAYHSLLEQVVKCRSSHVETQISTSRPHGKQIKEKKVWSILEKKGPSLTSRPLSVTIQASSPMPFNARREALINEFDYLLKLDRSDTTQISTSRNADK